MRRLYTCPSADGFHMPAEYEPHRGCLMIWPVRPGSWPYGAKDAQRTFIEIACAIAKSETVWMLAAPEQMDAVRKAFRARVREEEPGDSVGQERGEESGNSVGQERGEESGNSVGQEREEESGNSVGQKRGEEPGDSVGQERGEEPVNSAAQTPLKRAGVDKLSAAPNIYLLPVETDDAWARDVGPTCVVNNTGTVRGIDWQFNAWGGTVDGLYAHWEKDNRAAAAVCGALGMDCYDAQHFVLEGGSIHSDGEGTVLVTEACLLSAGRNPRMTKPAIEKELKQYLGAEKVIWLPRGIWQDETNEHVDNVCAFVRPGEVVLAWTDDEADPQWALSNASLRVLERETDARGRKLAVHKLPVPEEPVCITAEELAGFVFEEGEEVREAGERLAASYVNFYISNGAVIVPQFGDKNDAQAAEILKELFPEREIVPVYARPVIVGGGNIHCITQQIP